MNVLEWENWLGPEIKNNVDLVGSYLNEGDVFVDVGANTGLFTKMVLDRVGNEFLSKVILFEPIPYLFDECKNKFANNENIILNELALSDTEYETTILASKNNLGYNKIYTEGMEIHSHEKYTINCVTFSDWAFKNKIEKVNFVKVDAEGHDVNVIRGMFEWMRDTNQRPYILFEINWYKESEQRLIKDIETIFDYNSIDCGRDVLLIP
jgi:FkbM family methyltransferase